jgi:electron transfer flavoprotein alpha subunit
MTALTPEGTIPRVLVMIELDGATGEPIDASLRAVGLARSLGSVSAVAFGDAAPGGLAGVCDVYLVERSSVDGYAPVAWARVLAGLMTETGASAVLAAGTDRGNEVMAHLGAITGLPMAANCLAMSPGDDGGYRLVRQRWAGLLLEDAVLDAPVALLTVASDVSAEAPGAIAESVPAGTPGAIADTSSAGLTVHVHKPDLAEGDLAVRAVESAVGAGGVSLASARVVIGGGRGVGGADGFAPLEELADLLGGVVGVSRVVTSEGWRPHRQQVGQTGTKITPELYLACGISGAIQHIAGCAGAKHIIAINTDPGAPILAHADYAVIGDLHQVVPALVAALRERTGRLAVRADAQGWWKLAVWWKITLLADTSGPPRRPLRRPGKGPRAAPGTKTACCPGTKGAYATKAGRPASNNVLD